MRCSLVCEVDLFTVIQLSKVQSRPKTGAFRRLGPLVWTGLQTWKEWSVKLTPLLLLHDVQLLQLGLVLRLHATQHVPNDHHERVELKDGWRQVRREESVRVTTWQRPTNGYLIQVEVVVDAERHQVRQALGGQVFFGDAQFLVAEGALVDS